MVFRHKFYTFAFSSLTFKGFWTMVVYLFYEQVNICFCIHDLDFIYLWVLVCLSVCSSMVWTLLRDFGHLSSFISSICCMHAFLRLLFINECTGRCLFLPFVLLILP